MSTSNTKSFDHNQSYIWELDLNFSVKLQNRDNNYSITLELMTIKGIIINEKQHELRG